MKIGVIVQARTGSTRLPGKVLLRLGNRTVLEQVIGRCRLIPSAHEVVVATTVKEEDDAIAMVAHEAGVPFFRGSEQDVLSRYYHAARKHGFDVVVRVTSDCPFLDPDLSDAIIRHFLNNRYDYCSNGRVLTFPRGLDTEVFTFAALEEAYHQARETYEREHVTPYIYLRPEQYRLGSYENEDNQSHHRWTLDTPEDWQLIQEIHRRLPAGSTDWRDILVIVKDYPELSRINAHIEQKKLTDA